MNFVRSALPVRLDRATLWEGLTRKAADPVPFIPAITACTVLERYPDGLLREITIEGGERQRERGRFTPRRRIVFEQLTEPYLSSIENEIVELESGGLLLVLTVRLSAAGIERAEREPGYLKGTDEYFAGTLHSIVDTLHANAAAAAGRG